MEDETNVTFKNCIFVNNHAIRIGGVFKIVFQTILTLVNSTFENNTAEDGSFIHSYDLATPISIMNCTLKTNTGKMNLFDVYYSSINILDSIFLLNQNPTIFLYYSTLKGTNMILDKNFCVGIEYGCLVNAFHSKMEFLRLNVTGSDVLGSFVGNFYVFSSDLVINGTSFKDLKNYKWGICVFSKESNVSMNFDSFENFSSNCVYGEESNLLMNNTIFLNKLPQIYSSFICDSCIQVQISNSIFNTSFLPDLGGAITIKFTLKVSLESSVFLNNSAINAGAIYIYNSNTSISHCFFKENHAFFGDGGGIKLDNEKGRIFDFLILSSIFTKNTAKHEGGAIVYTDVIPRLINVSYEENSAFYGDDVASYGIRLGFRVFNTCIKIQNYLF